MIRIRAGRMSDAKEFRVCLDVVARERTSLAMVVGPTLRNLKQWMRAARKARCPLFVAVDGERIVGWCDCAPREMEGFRHSVGLGIGLIPEARGLGLGEQLLKKTIAACRRNGFERIELQVYANNRPARALYRKFGFRHEGRRVRGRKIDGKYDDIILMGKLL